ncbi:restriction endonuclease subunit S [Kitasatospora sp. NPDC088783]|uniref:restriction endonuclease subunit S n=1 Tax=Kitasatospora sp. NPDC088783 TaxID=3364077 RepID=UPI003823F99A
MTSWAMVRLEDVSTLQPGFARRRHSAETVSDGIPLVRPPDIGAHGEINGAPEWQVAESAALERYRLEVDDILCIRTGRPGATAVVTELQSGWLYSDTLFRIRARSGIDPRYLAHYLASPSAQQQIAMRAHGTTGIRSITGRDLAGLHLPLAGPDEQREIVAVMNAVTEKIAVHRQIVETATELRTAMATRLFAAEADSGSTSGRAGTAFTEARR